MRRILALTLSLLFLLCGCGGTGRGSAAPAHDPGVEELARAVSASQLDTAALTPLTGETLTDYLSAVCGIETAWWTEAAAYTASGVDAREMIFLRLSDEAEEDHVTAALEAEVHIV